MFLVIMSSLLSDDKFINLTCHSSIKWPYDTILLLCVQIRICQVHIYVEYHLNDEVVRVGLVENQVRDEVGGVGPIEN